MSSKMSDTLQLLVSGADHLRDQCTEATDSAAGSQESRVHTQQVIQSAYDIAKAAKQLVMLFEWLQVAAFRVDVSQGAPALRPPILHGR